jgi:hypothetical protein
MLVLNFSEIWWLRKRGFQGVCTKVCFWRFCYGLTVTVYQNWQPEICDKFTETDIQ